MSLVYIVFGRFERLSFDRQERYVRPIAGKISSISAKLEIEISKILTEIREKRRAKSELSPTSKICIFLGSAIIFMVLVGINIFFNVIRKVFFDLIIGWKGLNLGSLANMFQKFFSLIMQLLGPLRIPAFVVQALLYPFVFMYQVAELLSVDYFYKLLTVTCQGAKSPIELFVDCFVLGVAILFINSNYNFLWSATFQEMNRLLVVKHLIERSKLFSKHFVLSSAALFITMNNPFIIILRFFLSYVDFGAFFVNDHVMHFLSKACIGIEGFQNQELWLVDCTSVLVWLLIPPMLYITAEIVCPKGGYTASRTKFSISAFQWSFASVRPHSSAERNIANNDSEHSSIGSLVVSELSDMSIGSVVVSEFTHSSVGGGALAESNENDSDNSIGVEVLISEYDERSIPSISSVSHMTSHELTNAAIHGSISPSRIQAEDNLRTVDENELRLAVVAPLQQPLPAKSISVALIGALRYFFSYAALTFSTDLLFVYTISSWVAYCEKTNRLAWLRTQRAGRRWDPRTIQQSITRFRSERLVKITHFDRRLNYFGQYEMNAREVNSQLEKKWSRVAYQPDSEKLPPYYRLCYMVQEELCGNSVQNAFIRRIWTVITYVVAFSGIGHVLAPVGRKHWGIAIWKYILFICVCFGIWTDESYEAFKIEELVDEFTIMDRDEATIIIIPLTIASRAILLQAMGGTATLISIAVISMCGSPLFVFSPKLSKNIPPLIHFNPREVAMKREIIELVGRTNAEHYDGSIHMEEWVIRMRSLSILLTESRLLVFFANLVSLSMSMILLQGIEIPNIYLALLLIAILPYYLGSILIPIMYIGKRLNLTDNDFQTVFLSRLIRIRGYFRWILSPVLEYMLPHLLKKYEVIRSHLLRIWSFFRPSPRVYTEADIQELFSYMRELSPVEMKATEADPDGALMDSIELQRSISSGISSLHNSEQTEFLRDLPSPARVGFYSAEAVQGNVCIHVSEDASSLGESFIVDDEEVDCWIVSKGHKVSVNSTGYKGEGVRPHAPHTQHVVVDIDDYSISSWGSLQAPEN